MKRRAVRAASYIRDSNQKNKQSVSLAWVLRCGVVIAAARRDAKL
ncbi:MULTISPECIES: hypothetical protein [Comamonas]|nr:MULTISPECIES: hypothetical protein [Comamonas]